MINWIRHLIAQDLFDKIENLKTENEHLDDLISAKIKEQENIKKQLEESVKMLCVCEEAVNTLSKKSLFEKYLDEKNYPTTRFVYTKRWVLDKKNFPEARDIRDFIKNYYSLPKFERIDQVFTNPVRYVSDNYAYNGTLDVWQTAIETYTLGAGDCDDSGIYRACLARRLGNLDVFCALGFWKNQGHLFNLMFKDNKIYIVENTSNNFIPVEIKSLQDTGTDYKINYIFNENNVWIVNGDVVFGAKVIDDFNLFGDSNAVGLR